MLIRIVDREHCAQTYSQELAEKKAAAYRDMQWYRPLHGISDAVIVSRSAVVRQWWRYAIKVGPPLAVYVFFLTNFKTLGHNRASASEPILD